MCIVHQPEVTDLLDIVFHMGQLICKHLPMEICAFGFALSEYVSTHLSVPDSATLGEGFQADLNLQIAANLGALRSEYLLQMCKAALGNRLGDVATKRLHTCISDKDLRQKIRDVDIVCNVCDFDVLCTSYGSILKAVTKTGTFEISEVTDSSTKTTTNACSSAPSTSKPADGDGHGRFVNLHQLDCFGFNGDETKKSEDDKKGDTDGADKDKSTTADDVTDVQNVLTSLQQYRRLCFEMASETIAIARAIKQTTFIRTLVAALGISRIASD